MRWVIIGCFALSGATGLALEFIWMRLLTRVFGSTTLAISTALAAFMAGLALGNWLGGRLADRIRSPLRAYAICEAGIGVCALAIPLLLEAYPPVNVWLEHHLGDAPFLLSSARFALCGAVLIIPTTLMGATLPLLTRRIVDRPALVDSIGSRVGILYGANTAGACLGALAAGFILLEALGLSTFNAAVAAVDLVLAAFVWRWQPRAERHAGAIAHAAREGVADEPARSTWSGERAVAIAVFFCTGAIAMTIQVMVARGFGLVVGSSTYAFTATLVVFLAGLTLGAGTLGPYLATRREPRTALALTLVALAVAVYGAYLVLDDMPVVMLYLVERLPGGVTAQLTLQLLLCAVLILPTTVLLGAVGPIVVRLHARSMSTVGTDVGSAFSANTVGAIIGSWAGGFVVIPMLGLEAGFITCIAVLIALATIVTLTLRRNAKCAGMFAVCGVMVLGLVAGPRWDKGSLAVGSFRYYVAGGKTVPQRTQETVLYYRDGVSATVAVALSPGEGYRTLLVNGKPDASTAEDRSTQILIGAIPAALHSGRDLSVLVIGYGSGMTVGSIARSDRVGRVDVAEIEEAVYEAADRFFGEVNHEPQFDSKVHRHVADGRNFLETREAGYDIIASEPSNPWMAGIASLFTRDFYATAKQQLNPGGIFAQWVQVYELHPDTLWMIYRTFSDSFEYTYLFGLGTGDTLIVGSESKLPIQEIRDRLGADPLLLEEFRRAGTEDFKSAPGIYLLDRAGIRDLVGRGVVNTDDNAALEFAAARDFLAARNLNVGRRYFRSIFSRIQKVQAMHSDTVATRVQR